MANELERAKAKDEMVDSTRDLYTAKITLPLGNPNLKLVHTNQMLFTQLTEQEFELANFAEIAKYLNSTYTRFGGFVLNRWYVESVTINNNGTTGTMELAVNPFPSSLIQFKDNKNSFINAYSDAINKANSNNNTNSQKTVKSVSSSYTLKNVKGFSKSDQEYIKKVVTKALKAANNPKSPLKRAKAIFEFYRDNHVYQGYDCMRKMRKYGFEGTWKKEGHNCGDGAATQVAMFRCAGLDANIMHRPGHFYSRVKINGKYYYCDQAGAPGKHNSRTLGSAGNNKNVWGGISKSATVVGFTYC